ncbi:hypothetical protein LPB140_10735 [Sphingorhabdus lutea]|uniref:DUF4424 domain-containing protein n=1 Tax=Sphingorhabdus lutea TaxID=1913578 RepID=A0A1L3JDI2_9SPHN|nr:DUF4424 family protein [Sphingorhabdus lutea]APG63185.1 hypothetical protein LPB140_10735 [Sphingorhabdus lutea]
MKNPIFSLLTAAFLLASCQFLPAHANDSEAAIAIGGLELIKNDNISMESEYLFLSMDKAKVKYQYFNHSDKDQDILISFPLPVTPSFIEQEYLAAEYGANWDELNFTTLVDGQPVSLSKIDNAEIKGKNINLRLAQLGWPINYWHDDSIWEIIRSLNDTEKQAYIDEGLLVKGDMGEIYPNWQIATFMNRHQKFPAGKKITVEHEYKPMIGGSVAGAMDKNYREAPNSGFAEYRAQYCIDNDFLAGFDKKMAQHRKNNDEEYAIFYNETWLSYILKSGANWRGPIKNFHLVVDKGDKNNLLSLCMDGIKKISPTQFEVRKSNFEPAKDIDILIIQFFSNEN